MSNNSRAIFITGRFRSGTSFLWQLFDQMSEYCAWYEPIHPQLLASIKHTEPKSDHVGIHDYWTAFREHPEFESAYSDQFAFNKLYLEADDDYPELQAYINHLIQLSAPQKPVLQFNRMDFRLPWLKKNFPQATIIHIERNPIQLYHSQRKHIDEASKNNADYWDAYELLPWCYALSEVFPFLLNNSSSHAFFRFYALYQLSQLAAKQYVDVSINLDQHIFQSDSFINKLSSVVPLNKEQQSGIKAMTHIPNIPVFDTQVTDTLAEIMTQVDILLTSSGLLVDFPVMSLASIKQKYQHAWSQFSADKKDYLTLLNVINNQAAEMTRILAENDTLRQQAEQLKKQAEQLSNPTTSNE